MKKILCLLLSVYFATACFCTSAAGIEAVREDEVAVSAQQKVTDEYPLIIVSGMDFSDGLFYDYATPDEKNVNPVIDAGEIVRTLLKALFTSAFSFNSEKGISVITSYVRELLGGYACDENGDSSPRVSNPEYPLSAGNYERFCRNGGSHEEGIVNSAVARYGGDRAYFFFYDWRLDPMYNAGLLSGMIDSAMSACGADKVNLICCSMGGVVTLSYIEQYGSGKINSLVSDSATMYGTYVATDLFKGDAVLDADAAARYLKSMFPDKEKLINIAESCGMLKIAARLINKFIDKHKTQVYDEVLTPVFATMPAVWALVQPEDYETAKEYIFSGKEDMYAGVIAKADRIQSEVLARRDEIITAAVNGGMYFSVVANYNTPLVPVYKNCATQGDGILETAYMSLGATVSDVGGELSPEYLSSAASRYVSADKCIDASTCLYPDYTWFVKNAEHVGGIVGSEYTEFLFTLIEAHSQPDINSYSSYPQFMTADREEKLSPLT